MQIRQLHCPECNAEDFDSYTTYTVGTGEQRQIYYCPDCGAYFSETKNTPLAGLRRPLSFIIRVLDALNDGMGINAVCRTFHTGKNSVYRWLDRLTSVKPTLLLYALCCQFMQQIIEGDELYTKVNQNKPPCESEGWTIALHGSYGNSSVAKRIAVSSNPQYRPLAKSLTRLETCPCSPMVNVVMATFCLRSVKKH